MSRMIDSIGTLNSSVRTVIALVVIAGLAAGGWFGYTTYYAGDIEAKRKEQELASKVEAIAERDLLIGDLKGENQVLKGANSELKSEVQSVKAENEELTVKNEELTVENQRLETAVRLLKVDFRLARVTVLKVGTDEKTGGSFCEVKFSELNDKGQLLGKPKLFTLKGDQFYIDGWIVKFEDKYIENADFLRSKSLFVFKKIYGNDEPASGGFRLDDEGTPPSAYGPSGKLTDFEKQIWDDFWNLANNPERQKELGIRANHGETKYMQPVEGKTYEVLLRASDGLTIRPVDGNDVPPAIPPV